MANRLIPIRGSRELHANLLTVNLDKQFHARRLTATGNSSEQSRVSHDGREGRGHAHSRPARHGFVALKVGSERLNAIGNARGEHKTSIE